MEIRKDLCELIGGTPIVELSRIEKKRGLSSRLLAKLEYLNPSGSLKDRTAKAMIEDAEKRGLLKPGCVIVEPTSGNTGVGLAAVAAFKGYRAVIVMPDAVSRRHIGLLEAYGADVVLTERAGGIKLSIARAEEIAAATPNSFMPGQFVNPANPAAHFASTGPEIWRQTDGKIDIFVAGVGTGGAITGTGNFLKSANPQIRVVAVEPDGSPFLSEGRSGHHGIQGLGAGFAPAVLDAKVYDEVVRVSDGDAFATVKEIALSEGILVGPSSGAAIFAAIEISRKSEGGKHIVVLAPDSGERYIENKTGN
jgi:cysteine synthase A